MTTEREKYIGEQLKAARLRKNMTQEDVASRIGVTLATVSRLESGKGSSLDTFIKVVEVLGEGKWFDLLAPKVAVSPMSMKNLNAQRMRASKKRIKK